MRFAFLLLAALSLPAAAQDRYPARPVQVIIPFSPGGSVDVLGRHFIDGLAQVMKGQFVVLNRDEIGRAHV